MTILLSRIVPREQMIVVHAPLAEFEWPRTILRHNHHHDAVKQQLDRWMKEAKGGQQYKTKNNNPAHLGLFLAYPVITHTHYM